MSEHAIQRPRHTREVQRIDEQGSRLDLPAAVRTDEAPELLLRGPSAPGGLLLESAERPKVALGIDDRSTAATPSERISSSSRSASHT